MNLRELTNDQKQILALVENGDLSLEDVADHLGMLEQERSKKIENCLFVSKNYESRLSGVNAEIERLTEIKKQTQANIDKVESWLLVNLEDGEKHEFDLFKITKKKGNPTCVVSDESKIPMNFMRHNPESWSPDKRTLLAELKKGESIEGVELSIGKSSLIIK